MRFINSEEKDLILKLKKIIDKFSEKENLSHEYVTSLLNAFLMLNTAVFSGNKISFKYNIELLARNILDNKDVFAELFYKE